jgi:pyruvate,water dikinase
MLWGITTESVRAWLDGEAECAELRGFAASAGAVVGRARVVLSPDQLDEIEDGEILVTQLTSPSWAPVFARIGGTVTEVGGMMSHTAIVCREYGLPAVTGVSGATTKIRTGQLLRVDGCTGRVSVLD